ncbi:peroxidase, partial [Mycobacterium avium subsp. hominissuis]
MAVRRHGVHVRVIHVPPVQPQPILAPLTPAAIFLVLTVDDGG